MDSTCCGGVSFSLKGLRFLRGASLQLEAGAAVNELYSRTWAFSTSVRLQYYRFQVQRQTDKGW
jgi:hypothetical protein